MRIRRRLVAAIGLVLVAGAAMLSAAPAAASRPRLPDTFVPIQVARFPLHQSAHCEQPRRVRRVPSRRFPTIRSALAGAGAGTTVAVAPGRYTEQRREYSALQISASGVCLVAPRGHAILRAAHGQNYGLLLTGSRITVSGITLRGFSSAVSLGRADGRTQRSIVLSQLHVVGRSAGWTEGIVAYADHRRSGDVRLAG